MSDVLLYDQDGHIVTLTINRPETRNPLGEAGDGAAFQDAAQRIIADRSVRCVILTGAGKAFSAGGNIKAMQNREGNFGGVAPHIADGYRLGIHQIVKALWSIEVPMIAAVNGPAIGLGNDVACLADMRIASDRAIFGATFLKIGLIPGDGGAWLLPRTIGMARAAELLFTGKTISADEAQQWGLVSRVVPGESLMDEVRKTAEDIVKQSPESLRAAKRLLRHGQSVSFDTLMEMSASAQAVMHMTADHMEAVSAFIEKRDPSFNDE
jgi:enoyl-CoA hydratase/carnithine racemase